MTVSVRGSDNSTVQLTLPQKARAADAKAAVEAAIGAAQARQKLIWAGRVLDDGESLSAAGVSDGCCMHLALRPADAPQPSAATPPAAPGAPLQDEDLLLLQAALETELRSLAERAQRRAASQRSMTMREGDAADFWLGLSIGLLLGFLSVACMAQPGMSPRMKLGICLGVMLNMAGGVRRMHGGTGVPRDSGAEW